MTGTGAEAGAEAGAFETAMGEWARTSLLSF